MCDALLRRGQHGLQSFQGELLTDYYLDSLAEEIQTTVQSVGRIAVGELAVQHNLTAEFTQRLIEPRLGSIIEARVAGGALYTQVRTEAGCREERGVGRPLLLPIGW